MSLSISQYIASSYAAVLNYQRKPANQWEESAFLRELERQNGIDKKSLGSSIEKTLDYQANPGASFLAANDSTVDMNATDVITAASYGPAAQLGVPIKWYNADEVANTTENQKIDFVKSLLTNGIKTHDDKIERACFVANTNGFLGFPTHITSNGQGSDGGIDAGSETWWRNQFGTYTDDTDIEAGMTVLWDQCAKGSGSSLMPTGIVSDATTQALYESTQQALQRYVDTKELDAGFKVLAFKTSRYCFSQFASDTLYFWNPRSLQLTVSKEFFREMGETQQIPNQFGYIRKIYSALQLTTDNRSRLGGLFAA